VRSWQKIARRIRVPLGFLFAVSYLWLARPTLVSITVGFLIALMGLAVRASASGHVRKNETLAVSGPYAHTRNPLYFGSLILACGFVVASRSWWIAAIAIAMFIAIYVPVIRAEEDFLRAHFPEFEEYESAVPRIFPRLRSSQSSANSFSWHLYRKHREYNAAIGAALMIAALMIKMFWHAR
jgi:protein-S-isoprenylcysteine O-methyltransferase Ste14